MRPTGWLQHPPHPVVSSAKAATAAALDMGRGAADCAGERPHQSHGVNVLAKPRLVVSVGGSRGENSLRSPHPNVSSQPLHTNVLLPTDAAGDRRYLAESAAMARLWGANSRSAVGCTRRAVTENIEFRPSRHRAVYT